MENGIIDIAEVKVMAYVKGIRPSPQIRPQLDIGYNYDGRVIELVEIRPQWNDKTKIFRSPYARIRKMKSHGIWKLYWMRASGKWELYEPFPSSKSLDEIFTCIDKDAYGCFKG